MAEKDAFADRRKAHEEEYFHKRERELIEKMRKKAAVEADRDGLSEITGVTDQELLEDFQELGFTRDTIQLLHLVPLIYVAWADGGVTEKERDLIHKLAATHGVEEGSPAAEQLDKWIEIRPSDSFLNETLRLIRELMSVDRGELHESNAQDLVYCCTQIAQVSGGILGFGKKISDAERTMIDKIAREIEREHPTASESFMKS